VISKKALHRLRSSSSIP